MKINPTKPQQKIFKKWIDDARLVYNTCVNVLSGTSEKSDKYKLRNKYVIEKNTKVTNMKLLRSMKRTPKDVRAKAAFEACAAHDLSIRNQTTINPKYKSYEKALKSDIKLFNSITKKLANRKKSTSDLESQRDRLELSIANLEDSLKYIPKFMAKTSVLNKRLRKNQYDHIFIPKTACKIKDKTWTLFPSYKVGNLEVKESVSVNNDFQIRWNRRINAWHIITSKEIDTKVLDQKDDKNDFKTIVIDPGVRTFLTCLDSKNTIKEFGKNWRSDYAIANRIKKLDYCSSISLVGKSGQERYNSLKAKGKRQIDLHRKKLQNLVNELHKKTARSLLDNYDVIILPKLRTKGMLKKEGGLGKDTNRNISLISHGKFHDYLTWKATTEGKIVIDQNEAYTTKTCFQCGSLNDIGSSKNYVCNHCDNKCDRDIQSCYNIMTKYMSSYSSTID